MKKSSLSWFLMFSILLMFVMSSFAGEGGFQYIGSKKCKMCHNSKKSGQQYKVWEASPHAKAYETLASDEAKAIAKKMGIEDPQKSDKCLTCHVTGYGKDASMFAKTFKMEEGVGCEACHGPGSAYKKMKVMKGIHAGNMKAADYGLEMPDQKHCTTCHNENSPTYKKFDYKTFWEKIAHPIPEKK